MLWSGMYMIRQFKELGVASLKCLKWAHLICDLFPDNQAQLPVTTITTLCYILKTCLHWCLVCFSFLPFVYLFLLCLFVCLFVSIFLSFLVQFKEHKLEFTKVLSSDLYCMSIKFVYMFVSFYLLVRLFLSFLVYCLFVCFHLLQFRSKNINLNLQ